MPLLSPWAGCLFFTSSLSRLLRRSCGPRGKRPSCSTILWGERLLAPCAGQTNTDPNRA